MLESVVIAQPYLSVIIPAYNEEKKIETDLAAALEYFRSQSYAFELIAVDDGSADRTPQILRAWDQQAAEVRAICYQPNRGKGYAVRTGMLAAKGEVRMFADAGLCVPYSETAAGLEALRNGCDVAIGSRKLAASRIVRAQASYRQWGSRVFGAVARRVMGLGGITDTQCGFKFYTARAAAELFGASRIDGFMFDAEILILARRRGMQIREFPVAWRADPDTRYRPLAGSLRNALELARIKFR
jgi:dolichyl-phosphate beta-glucosyltransferase